MNIRESAIGLAFPQFAAVVDRWRLATIPEAGLGVPPHVTLLYPWRAAPLTAEDVAAVAAALAGVGPFELAFRSVGRFAEAGILYLRPEPVTPVLQLVQRLMAAFPETPPYGGAFTDPIPHLTVAQAASSDELDAIEREIGAELRGRPRLVARISQIDIVEEQPDGRWQQTHAVPLGRR